MSTRPISPEQGPPFRQLRVFPNRGRAPERRKQVRAWLAGYLEAPAEAAEAEADRRLLRLFRASRPERPSLAAWEQSLTRIESALLAGWASRGKARPVQALPASVATGRVASIRREHS
jgi:hypothetical protein